MCVDMYVYVSIILQIALYGPIKVATSLAVHTYVRTYMQILYSACAYVCTYGHTYTYIALW